MGKETDFEVDEGDILNRFLKMNERDSLDIL